MLETEAGWIGGRRFDLVFFFGSSAAAALIGLLLVAAPALVVPVWWAWLFFFDGPHLVATWARTYIDADQRRHRGRLLVLSLAFLLPGPIALLAGKAVGSPVPFDLFLLSAAIWSWHHNVRQHYGLLSIYERLAGSSPRVRRIDTLFLQVALYTLFALFLVGHPHNRVVLSLPAELPRWVARGVLVVGALLAVAGAAYAVSLVIRSRRGVPVKPGLFALLPVLLVTAFGFFVIGAFEPLIPHPTNPEQSFLAVAVVGGIVHGAQYLGIVFAANRRRYAREGARSIAASLGRSPPLAYGVFVLLSLGYLGLNAARGTSPGAALYPENSDAARLFLGLYWGLFFHHYYLDQKIWRPHSDPALRLELGLERPA